MGDASVSRPKTKLTAGPTNGNATGIALSGYVPVFSSIFQGTLCGKWPDTGVWLCLLALADKNGHIDCIPDYISVATGVGRSELSPCLKRFRDLGWLEPLYPHLTWGWRITDKAEMPQRRPSRLPASQWAVIRDRIFFRDGYTCTYCGVHGTKLECDHVIPFSRGGSDKDENLATACFDCNRSKRAKTLEEWRS